MRSKQDGVFVVVRLGIPSAGEGLGGYFCAGGGAGDYTPLLGPTEDTPQADWPDPPLSAWPIMRLRTHRFVSQRSRVVIAKEGSGCY